MEKITLSTGITRMALDSKVDVCPICKTPLTNVAYRWNIFHGEATGDCCGAIFQIKDYYVDPETTPQDEIDFVDSLGKNGRIEFCIKDMCIKPLAKAIKETGIKNINNETVMALAESYLK